MADLLRADYKDDVLNTEVNTQRKYQMITNADGTVSFVDVTDYSQVGDSFSGADINKTNEAVNELNNAKANYQGNDDVSLVCNDSHMQVVNKANNAYRPVYASDFLFNGYFSLREHTPYTVGSIIVSCTNGEVNINFSILGISSRPSVVMAQLQSDQGFIVYNYDNSNSYVNLNIFTRKKDSSGIVSEEGIVPAPTGTYRIGVIVYK